MALLARLLLGRWRTREHLSMLRDALARIPAATLRQRAAATLRVDVRALLPAIDVPTLCLHACHDRLLWPPSVAELQALCRMPGMFRWKGRICCCRHALTQPQPKLPRG